jgi:hypothetical protein
VRYDRDVDAISNPEYSFCSTCLEDIGCIDSVRQRLVERKRDAEYLRKAPRVRVSPRDGPFEIDIAHMSLTPAISHADRAPHGRCSRHIPYTRHYRRARLPGSAQARDWTGR